jgi:hypothetical protein
MGDDRFGHIEEMRGKIPFADLPKLSEATKVATAWRGGSHAMFRTVKKAPLFARTRSRFTANSHC